MASTKGGENWDFGTRAVHFAQDPDPGTGAVIPPLCLSTTFKQDPDTGHKGYEYSRSGNPTRNQFEAALASLEGGKYGFAFASGLAAQTTFFSLFPSGAHVILINDCYGGTYRLLKTLEDKNMIKLSIVDLTDLKNLEKEVTSQTQAIWLESPTNPTLSVVDIQEIVKKAKEINPSVLIVVDNTLLTPFFQTPISLGADVVAHSVTKYIGGHSDTLMGALVVNDSKLAEKLSYYQNAIGAVPSPFDCFLAHRGIKTLHLRMKRIEENALEIAKVLESSPVVESVKYTGLKSFKYYELAVKQQKGFGGLISFTIKGGLTAAKTFLKALKLFTFAESLGAVESLIEIPALMTHASIPENELKALGITPSFIRISVGIESPNDLVEDIQNGLNAAAQLIGTGNK